MPATGLLFPLAIHNADTQDGSTIRLMRANFERLIDGAGEAAAKIVLDDYQGGPILSIGINCIGRRLVLGQRTEEELEAVCHDLPQDSALIGYYAYGEISPLKWIGFRPSTRCTGLARICEFDR